MLDSGNYDLRETEARKKQRERDMKEVKSAMARENSGQVILSIFLLFCNNFL